MSRWKLVPLKRMARVSYGLGQPPPPAPHGVPILRATNIHRGRILPEGLMHSAREDIPVDRAPLLKAGEILVVRSGAYTGDSALVTKEWEGAAPGYDLRLSPYAETEPRFLAYQMLAAHVLHQVDLARSRAAQPHLNAEDLGGIQVHMPRNAEQQVLADFLDRETARIDALIEARRRLRKAIRTRFDIAIAEAVLGDAKNRRNSGPYALPSHWDYAPIRRFLTSISDGPFGSLLASKHYRNSGARVVRLGNIGRAEFRDEDKAFIDLSYYKHLGKFSVRRGDLLMAGLGDDSHPLGRACLAPPELPPAIVKADCYRVRLDENRLRHDYSAWFFSSRPGLEATSAMTRGATRSRINTRIAAGLMIPIPPVEEQAEIASQCQSVKDGTEAVLQALSRQIDRLLEHRQALITAVVTGELRVPAA